MIAPIPAPITIMVIAIVVIGHLFIRNTNSDIQPTAMIKYAIPASIEIIRVISY